MSAETALTVDQKEAASVALTPMEVLSRAVESGAPMETLSQLMELQERWEANQARKAFDRAMAEAKASLGPIAKNRVVGYEGRNGKAGTSYRHEDLAQIERQVGPPLAQNGLSYRFRVYSEPNNPVRVTCVIAHREGHFEETTLSAGADTSGSKNSIQAIGSAITYLQRYTLKAALGLAVSHDDDGAKAGEEAVKAITEEQVMELRDLMETVGADPGRFLAHLRLESLTDMPASRYRDAVAQLKRKGEARG